MLSEWSVPSFKWQQHLATHGPQPFFFFLHTFFTLSSRCTSRLRIPITFHLPRPLWCLSSRAIFPGPWSCGRVSLERAPPDTFHVITPYTPAPAPHALPCPSRPSALSPHTLPCSSRLSAPVPLPALPLKFVSPTPKTSVSSSHSSPQSGPVPFLSLSLLLKLLHILHSLQDLFSLSLTLISLMTPILFSTQYRTPPPTSQGPPHP